MSFTTELTRGLLSTKIGNLTIMLYDIAITLVMHCGDCKGVQILIDYFR